MQSQTLPIGWESVKLGEICAITSGHGFKFNEYSKDGVKLLRINNVTFGQIIWDQIAFLPENYIRDYPKLVLNEGDLLIALNRPILGGRLKIGIMKKTDLPAILYQRVGRIDIRDNSKIDPIFLYHLMRTTFFLNELSAKLSGSDQPYINPTEMVKITIPLPPLLVQHQIVALLEEAEAVKRQRQEADALTGALLQSVFLEMFGNPETNEKGWETVSIGDIADHVSSGSTPRGGSDVYDTSGIMFIRSQNIRMNRLVDEDIAYISEEIHQSMKRSQLIDGDVLFNITGASIGRVAWFTGGDHSANVNQHVCIIRTDKNKILPEFLSYQLSLPSYQNNIMANQSGATRQAFNYSQIKNFDIFMPPIALQQQFAHIVERVERLRDQQVASGKEIEGLCEGLMAMSFAGELVL
ncbi:MAG: restriction endonuclease subunit S [Methanoregula sp.]|jgi:type I restriction enzyme S subunit